MLPEARASEIYTEYIELFILFALIAAIVNWLAWKRHFFVFPSEKSTLQPAISFKVVFSVFLIYLGTMLGLGPLIGKALRILIPLRVESTSQLLLASGLLQLGLLTLVVYLLYTFCRRSDPVLMQKIWKDPSLGNPSSIGADFAVGIFTWLLGFPVVAAIGQLCDLLIYYFTGIESYEQVAVKYLKMSMSSPLLLVIAATTIVFFAPFIEEFLFRGCLQTFLKKHLGRKAAILLASLCFALFHMAASQGIGNISLGISLLTFSCYLGFVYEKRASLFASIGLHMTFNAVSTIRILLM